MKKIIGILGGIGPISTGHLYLYLIERFQEVFSPKKNEDYPHIIINSIPAPELIYGGKNRLDAYTKGLKLLERAGANVILIACNSAHVFLGTLSKKVSVPILNTREILEEYLSEKEINRITVLGSPATIKEHLYAFKGIKSNKLSAGEIKKIGKVIERYNLGIEKHDSAAYINRLINEYSRTSDAIILGCSEIASMIQKSKKNIDPLKIAIDTLFIPLGNFLQKKKSSINGYGIFTTRTIRKGGVFYHIPLTSVYHRPMHRFAYIGNKKFVNDNRVLNWINHSCSPNSMLIIKTKNPYLLAIRNIKIGEEITCDYNKTEIGEKKIKCTCKSKRCKGYFLTK